MSSSKVVVGQSEIRRINLTLVHPGFTSGEGRRELCNSSLIKITTGNYKPGQSRIKLCTCKRDHCDNLPQPSHRNSLYIDIFNKPCRNSCCHWPLSFKYIILITFVLNLREAVCSTWISISGLASCEGWYFLCCSAHRVTPSLHFSLFFSVRLLVL